MAGAVNRELRHFAVELLDAVVAALHHGGGGHSGDATALFDAVRALGDSHVLTPLIDHASSRMIKAVERDIVRVRRRDPFKRLLVHPLADSFSSKRLSRDLLPNYFNFIHLVLGDETRVLAGECLNICESLQSGDESDPVDWDRFYDDSRSKAIMWTVLVRIASAFRRFEARRDWFLGLMQNHPQAVSLASNAFLPLPHEAEPPMPFGLAEFNMMFGALFGPMRRLSVGDEDAFMHAVGSPVADVFGDMWTHLEKSGAPL